MVITTSAFSTQERALATISTPLSAAASRDAATTSKPRMRSPDLTRLAAIGPPILPRPMNPIFGMCVSLNGVSVFELQFQGADRLKVPLDDVRRDLFQRVGPPRRITILVDNRGADAFDHVVPGRAGQRDTVILDEAFLNAVEFRCVPHVAQRDLQRGRRGFLHGGERRLRGFALAHGQPRKDLFSGVRAVASIDPGPRRFELSGSGWGGQGGKF